MARYISWSKIGLIFLAVATFIACDGKQSVDNNDNDDPEPIPTLDLSFTAAEFSLHAGSDVNLAVLNRETGKVIKKDSVGIADGSAAFSYSDLLVEGNSYYLSYYVDVNGNGDCDGPPTDHGWVLKIDRATEDVVVVDNHRMSFSDPCLNMNDTEKADAGSVIEVTGSLALNASVSDADGLTAGQSLDGANVFIKGYPNQEAITDSAGNFTLSVNVGSDLNITKAATELSLVMWYTQFEAGKGSFDWIGAKARFGAIKTFEVSSDSLSVDVESQKLDYTAGIQFKIVSSGDLAKPLKLCTVTPLDVGFQLVVDESASSVYTLDYLPPGDYDFTIACAGQAVLSKVITVGAVTSANAWETLADIVVEPAL